jgi:hypothetical protein
VTLSDVKVNVLTTVRLLGTGVAELVELSVWYVGRP